MSFIRSRHLSERWHSNIFKYVLRIKLKFLNCTVSNKNPAGQIYKQDMRNKM